MRQSNELRVPFGVEHGDLEIGRARKILVAKRGALTFGALESAVEIELERAERICDRAGYLLFVRRQKSRQLILLRFERRRSKIDHSDGGVFALRALVKSQQPFFYIMRHRKFL